MILKKRTSKLLKQGFKLFLTYCTVLFVIYFTSCEVNPTEELTSGFTVNKREGSVPLTVSFKSKANGAARQVWEFGDSSKSTEQNPVHTYYDTGNFVVTFTTYGSGKLVSSSSTTISVTEPTADFSIDQKSEWAPSKINLSNLTDWASELTFDFGNGGSSNEQNPSVLFKDGGTYDITLTAKGTINNITWNKSVTKTIVIKEEPSKIFISNINLTKYPEKQPDGSEWVTGGNPNVYVRLIDAMSGEVLWQSNTLENFNSNSLPKEFSKIDYTIDDLSKKYAIELIHAGNTFNTWMGGYYLKGEEWKSVDGSPYPNQITLKHPNTETEFKIDIEWLP